jgi:Kef-type K+ transport system membrane component KefB/nucleotide-binding universal stress UspA family protein
MLEHILEEPVGIFLVIIAVVLISPLLIERLRLPGIVGLIVGGILIGPNVIGLLEVGPAIELLSTVGLIYLMFNAGLEIDLRQFNQVRNKALVFGLLTFSIPLVVGIFLGQLLGLGWASSVLMGSVYASHTLVSFPILSRLGIMRNESVAITIGATVFTDVGALLVLAIIVGSANGAVSAAFILELVFLMAVYTLLIAVGVPRLGKYFFRHYSGPSIEFQFVLVVLFVAALLAEVIGMHAIVGAFLAGLAVNATLPAQSVVAGRVLFLGEALFVPIFLVYVGMVIDPLAVVTSQRTLLIGAALTFAVYVTKFAAAWLTGRIFNYERNEILTMWGLSQAQAAATLATILIGVEIGLLSQEFFNGTILMVLFTTLTSPLLVQRFGAGLEADTEEPVEGSSFKRILVPVANPKTQEHLIALAAILARTVEGTLFPLRVTQKRDNFPLDLQRERETIESDYLESGEEITIQPIHRVDASVSEGILNAALENRATMIVMGWRGKATFRQSIFGTILDDVIWSSTVPVLVGRLTMSINAMQRVVLVIPANSLVRALLPETVEMASTIARTLNVRLLILVARRYGTYLEEILGEMNEGNADEVVVERVEVESVVSRVEPTDLTLITTTGSPRFYRSSLGYIPERVAAQTEASLVVIHHPTS